MDVAGSAIPLTADFVAWDPEWYGDGIVADFALASIVFHSKIKPITQGQTRRTKSDTPNSLIEQCACF